MKKIFLIILFLLFISYIFESIVNKHSFHKGSSINHIRLPDIIHDNLPHFENLQNYNDYFIIIITLLFFIIFIFYKKFNLILLYIILFLITRIINYIYFTVTTLPDSSKKCVFSENLFNAIKNLGSCNNLNISGHFNNLCIQLYFFYKLFGIQYWFIYLILYILGFLFICASRNHYTIDCINSTIICLLLISQIKPIIKILNYIIGNNYFYL